jgi:hypothetical protein
MQMEKTNRIVAALILGITTIAYIMTVAPTVSFWDCGEFIACSFKMAVPHPPGAPLYLLLGRFFSLLPIPGDVGFRVNMISVISSAFTIMLLYLTIVHLVRQWKGELKEREDWYTAIFSGIIGSLAFAFSHSFWFNAAEAEVYAVSMLTTALIVWLIMVWAVKSDEPGNERYLLIIAYLIGLAIAIHLLNVLALPFVAMIYYYKKYEFNLKSFLVMTVVTGVVMLAVYPGLYKWLPLMALKFGAFSLALFFVVLLILSWWAVKNHRHIFSLIFLSVLLISIGYSSYASIYIRSNLNPNIDENNPETMENFFKYLNREQYGDHSITDRAAVWKSSPNGKQWNSVSHYFWGYQVDKMYLRYLKWQFIGLSDDETNVDFSKFWGLPLLLGFLGMGWHFYRDKKHGLAVLGLFFMTGLAIVLYLNQPDPQPRERDYSYVGSFFAFAIWIGLGYAAIIDFLKDMAAKKGTKLKPTVYFSAFIILFALVPLNMFAKNYHSHNRTGNYVAWDYSYNMLMNCEKDAILFTNGDNDTFPLWYLQEVEGVRTDVRIVNLSLLNTDWYIRQLRDLEPKVPMRVNELELERLGLRPWKSQVVSVQVPKQVALDTRDEYKKIRSLTEVNLPDKISFKVDPTMNTPYGSVIRTQDYMILNILTSNRWQRPIYFAVTVPQSNLLGELTQFLRMDGLLYRLVPYKNWRFSPTLIEKNLTEVFQYRGLNDPDVYFNHQIKSLLQNYRSAFIQVADYYTRQGNKQKVQELLHFMEDKISSSVIPWASAVLRQIKYAFSIYVAPAEADSVIGVIDNVRDLTSVGENLLRMRQFEASAKTLEKACTLQPTNPRALGMLIQAYKMAGMPQKAVGPLRDWLNHNPNDKNAELLLQEIENSAKSEE